MCRMAVLEEMRSPPLPSCQRQTSLLNLCDTYLLVNCRKEYHWKFMILMKNLIYNDTNVLERKCLVVNMRLLRKLISRAQTGTRQGLAVSMTVSILFLFFSPVSCLFNFFFFLTLCGFYVWLLLKKLSLKLHKFTTLQ